MFDKNEIFIRYPALESCRGDMVQALDELIGTARRDGMVLLCGNGGSCADSDHIVGELMKGFLLKRPLPAEQTEKWKTAFGQAGREQADRLQQGIRAISLHSQAALVSAYANDCDPVLTYAQVAWNYARPGDYFIGISTSGNAKNVLAAARAAKLRGCFVLALTGRGESALSEIADVSIRVPEQETYKVQEYHLPVYHWLCAGVEDVMFGGFENG